MEQDFVLHYLELDGLGSAKRHQQLPQKLPASGGHWLHLDCNDEAAPAWLATVPDVPESVVDALFAEETRPRAVKMGSGILLTLRGVNLNPGSDPSDMVSLRLWITPHVMISTRRRRLLSVADQVQLLEQGEGATTIAELLTTLTQTLTDRMANVIAVLEESLSDLEERMSERVESQLRATLVDYRLQTVRLRRFVVPQRDAIMRLASEMQGWLTKEQAAQIGESGNDITRYVEALESLRERCLYLQEEFTNHQAEKMNARMYVLSILSGIFMPLGFLTGLFGINVGGLPGTENGDAFWWFCAVLVVMGIGQYWLMRKSRWF